MMRREKIIALLLSLTMAFSGTQAAFAEETIIDVGEVVAMSGEMGVPSITVESDDSVSENTFKTIEEGNSDEIMILDIEEVDGNTDGNDISSDAEKALQEEISRIISFLGIQDKSDYEKIFAIYNYVCQNVEYDWEATNKTDWDGASLGYGQFAYEALCEGKAVCAGISDAVAQLMNNVGIECYVITGTEIGIGHAWNLVRMDGTFYYLDATTDLGQTSYNKFLKGSNTWGEYEADSGYEFNNVEISETDYNDPVSAEYAEIDGFVVNTGLKDITIFSYKGSDENVIVPAELNGRKVKRIAQYAFQGNQNMKTLTISEGIEKITSLFVGNCDSLEKISLPSSARLVAIGSDRFITGQDGLIETCMSLKEITVPEDNPYLTVNDGILYNKECTDLLAFPRAVNIEQVTIPEGVTSIKSDAFSGNTTIKKVTLPDSVTSIGGWAFSNCNSLSEINIPANCQSIGQYAFMNTAIRKITIPAGMKNENVIAVGILSGTPLETIEVEDGNPYYVVKDGALCLNNKTLLFYETASSREEIEIPEGITFIVMCAFQGAENLKRVHISPTVSQIDAHAFYGCENLEEVDAENSSLERIGYATFSNCHHLKDISLPQSLKEIEEYAFADCSNLQSIRLPVSVNIIGNNAFIGTSNLKKIYYEGSKEQWDAIDKGNNFEDADIIFNSEICEEVIKGDVDGDGSVKINDLLLILHAVSGSTQLNEQQEMAADIDSDGQVSIRDLLVVLHYISGSSNEMNAFL